MAGIDANSISFNMCMVHDPRITANSAFCSAVRNMAEKGCL